METIGWLSALCLMICGIPEAWKSYKEGSSELSDGLVVLWLVGEFLGLLYVIYLGKGPLIANYLVNLGAISIIFRYKYWPVQRKTGRLP